MFGNSEELPQYLQLSSRTLRFGSQIYQLKNITNVAMIKIRPWYFVSIKGFIISGILFFVLAPIETDFARIVLFISIIIFIGGICERLIKKPYYALHLETSAGSQRLISSSDKNFIEQIVSKIYSFMDDDSLDAKYVFNLEDRSIQVEGNISHAKLASGDHNIL